VHDNYRDCKKCNVMDVKKLRKMVKELSKDPEKLKQRKIENGKRDATFGRSPTELSGPYYVAYQIQKKIIEMELWNDYARKQNEYT